MDALCDPRAFLSAQEKRAEQLKALGIEEADISENVIESKKGEGGDKAKPGDDKAGGKKEDKKEEKKEELNLEPITPKLLMKEKAFAKATKKQSKELETMAKKQKKERDGVANGQIKAFDKAAAKVKK